MMILTCPNCATRFFAERESVGPAGRRVKCSVCGAEWVAYKADEEPAHGEAEPKNAESRQTFAPISPPTPEDAQPVARSAQDYVPEVTPVGAPEPKAAPDIERVEDDGGAPAMVANWPERAEAPGPELVDTSTPAADPETPLFADRSAPAKRRSGPGLVILILLIVIVAALAALVYYRVHHAPGSPPSGATATAAPSAKGG